MAGANWSRCRDIINALVDQETDNGTLTEAQKDQVLDILNWFSATTSDFTMLDEKPGYFGYKVKSPTTGELSEWHYKLRQVRNTRSDLFDVLIRD